MDNGFTLLQCPFRPSHTSEYLCPPKAATPNRGYLRPEHISVLAFVELFDGSSSP